MANTLDAIKPKILARGLLSLRGKSVLPMLVNTDQNQTVAQRKGDTITVPLPPVATVSDVVPAETPPAGVDTTAQSTTLVLNRWRKSSKFYLTDRDVTQIDQDENFVPQSMSAAVEVLARDVNQYIFSLYKGVYGFAGTPGTTPFKEATPVVDVAADLMGVLDAQLAPQDPRYVVLDFAAQAAARSLPAFSNADKAGADDTLRRGVLGMIFGATWMSDNDVPKHTTAAAGTPLVDFGGGYAVGAKTIHMDGFTTKPEAGDIFEIPNRASGVTDTQTYVVVSSTALAGTDSDVTFEPGLKVALAAGDDDEAVSFKGNHRVNLAFHRDAIMFASRPVEDLSGTANVTPMTDRQTGLSMRLEMIREYKQTAWELDILYGASLIRAELAARLAG
jgi:hypothetical protein